ncbi:hypothetical protein IJI72_00245 [Candidatus Saccharibacteria bacterium]|nr:hypothetical protein [Candidatus Saccharibacteria bacterium]
MLPDAPVIINNNLEFCSYLATAYTDSPYDCSNVANDAAFELTTPFISPAGASLTLKNLNLSITDPSVYLNALGSLTLENVTMTGTTGCFLLVNPVDSDQPLLITSGTFSTTDIKNSSPICYRPSIVESNAETALSEPEVAALFRSIIPATSSYFIETASGTREEITEITELVGGLPVVKGYTSRALALNSTTLIIAEQERGEIPDEPAPDSSITPTETPVPTTPEAPKAPNTGATGSTPKLSFFSNVLKKFKNITKTVLTHHI